MINDLVIRVEDFNSVITKPDLLKKLRKLTLYPFSGMNQELNKWEKLVKTRPVNVKILLAYKLRGLVGWAILSHEDSDCTYESGQTFRATDGVLFEVFIDPNHRRQGIASELIKVARRKAGLYRLCIVPWDEASDKFYEKFSNYNAKHI